MTPTTTIPPSPTIRFRATLLGLLLLTGLFLINFISRLIFAPLLPVIEGDLGLSHAASGSLFFFISIGYFISIVLSGFVSARINHKRTIVVSTLLSGFFLIVISLSESLLALRFGLFCLGLSAGLYLPSGIASITSMVPPQYLARGMAIHELAPNISFVAVPLLSTVILARWSWGQGIGALGAVIIGAGILYSLIRSGDTQPGVRPNFSSVFNLLSKVQFWLLVMMFALGISSTLGLYTMLPLFLVTNGTFDLNGANTVLALSRFCTIFSAIIGGWAGDRFGHRKVILTVLMCSGLLTLPMGFVTKDILLVLLFLQPMIAVCFFPSGFSVLTRVAKKTDANLVVSLCIPVAFLAGGGLMPSMIGWVGDHYSLALGFFFAGLAFCVGGGLAALYWQPEHTEDQEEQ